MRGGFVGPPIEKESADKMNDDQWISAIVKYNSDERGHNQRDFLKGGATELARLLQGFTKEAPERFGLLALRLPANANPEYLDRILAGLTNAPATLDLKLKVCRKAFAEAKVPCAKSIMDLLGSIEEPLPEDCVVMIHWVATAHPDPEEELWQPSESRQTVYYGGDIYDCGINCARGRAAEAIAKQIWDRPENVARFMPTLEALVRDASTAVRSCAAHALIAVAVHDTPLAIRLFGRLADQGPELLSTPLADNFIYRGLKVHFDALRPYVETLLRSESAKAAEAGSRLASLAVLCGHAANELVEEALERFK
jgi:hypothetical protein